MTDRKELTSQQMWEEVLKKCGFEYYIASGNWRSPDGNRYPDIPEVNDERFLGFFFKWVVPELKKRELRITYNVDFSSPDFGKHTLHYWAIFRGAHQLLGMGENDDVAEALLQAAWEVLCGK